MKPFFTVLIPLYSLWVARSQLIPRLPEDCVNILPDPVASLSNNTASFLTDIVSNIQAPDLEMFANQSAQVLSTVLPGASTLGDISMMIGGAIEGAASQFEIIDPINLTTMLKSNIKTVQEQVCVELYPLSPDVLFESLVTTLDLDAFLMAPELVVMAISEATSGVYGDFNAKLVLERALVSGLIPNISLSDFPTLPLFPLPQIPSLAQLSQLLPVSLPSLPLIELADIVEVFGDAYNQTGVLVDGIFDSIEDLQEQQIAALNIIFADLQNQLQDVVVGVGQLFAGAFEMLENLQDQQLEALESVFNDLQSRVEKALESVTTFYDGIVQNINNLLERERAAVVYILGGLFNQSEAAVDGALQSLNVVVANVTGEIARFNKGLPSEVVTELTTNVTVQLLNGWTGLVSNISGQIAKFDQSLPKNIATEITANITQEILQLPFVQLVGQSQVGLAMLLGGLVNNSEIFVSNVVQGVLGQPIVQGTLGSFNEITANVTGQVAKVEPTLLQEIANQLAANVSGEISKIDFFLPFRSLVEVSSNVTGQVSRVVPTEEFSQVVEQLGVAGFIEYFFNRSQSIVGQNVEDFENIVSQAASATPPLPEVNLTEFNV